MQRHDNWNLNPHYQNNQPVKPDQFGKLFDEMKTSIRAAQQQKLSATDEVKKVLLTKFREDGLRAEHLVNFRIPEVSNILSRAFVEAAAIMFDDYYLRPEQVVAELNGLYDYQAYALRDCYANGLRGDHLRSWKKGTAVEFYLNHWEVLKWLIKDKGIAAEQAVRLLDNQPSRALDEIKKEALQRLEQLASASAKPSTLGLFAAPSVSVVRQPVAVLPPAPPPVVAAPKPAAPHYKDEDDGRYSSPQLERFRY